jgi:ParB family chromosome partitioning protein
MGIADTLKKKFGNNMAESLGVRSAPAEGTAPIAAAEAPDTGRSRMREAGVMEIDRIIPDPAQPRKEFDAEALGHLAASIKAKGQLLPLRVRWNPELGKWVILSGERRWRAAQLAGLKTVSCILIDRALTDSERLEEQLLENILREDLRPIEQARAFSALMSMNQWTAKDLAEALHVSPATVSRALPLLDLPQDLQEKVDAGDIPASAGYQLARVEDEGERQDLAEKIAAGDMTRDQAAQAIRQKTTAPSSKGGRPARRVTSRTLTVKRGTVVVTVQGKASAEDLLQAIEQAAEVLRAEVRGKQAA